MLAVHEESNAAVRLLNHGVEAFSQGEYDAAESVFEAARTDFSALVARIEAAQEQAVALEEPPAVETVDIPTLRDRLDHLR